MIRWTLRVRVLVGLGVVALVLAGVALGVTRTMQVRLIDQVDEQLVSIVREGGGIPRTLRERVRPGVQRERFSDVYEGLLLDDGTLLTIFEPNTPGRDFSPPDFVLDDVPDRAWTAFTVDAVDGSVRYRVMASEATAFADVSYAINAVPLDAIDESIARLVGFQAMGLVVALTALGAVAFWVVRLGIRPVQAMTDAADRIAGGDLGLRVPEPTAPDTESGRLAVALNTMLARIETEVDARSRSEQRLRRFVADASHELRTPLTTIRGYSELYGHGGLADEAELDDAMRRTGQEAERMTRLVEDMLTLARLDRERPDQDAIVQVSKILDDAVTDLRATAPQRPLANSVEPGLRVNGDDDRLRQVVANLVRNAVVHTPQDATISIGGRRIGSEVVVTISDNGPGMAPEVAAQVTERFFRADASRSRESGGSGLGLAIAEAIVTGHGGSLEIDSSPGAGTAVTVRLPTVPSPTP